MRRQIRFKVRKKSGINALKKCMEDDLVLGISHRLTCYGIMCKILNREPSLFAHYHLFRTLQRYQNIGWDVIIEYNGRYFSVGSKFYGD